MAFPMLGQDLACPRIAGPLTTYIGTNGHSPNILAMGARAPCLFREPAGAAVIDGEMIYMIKNPRSGAGREILVKTRKRVLS
jgi:hypothetical protein